MANKMKIDGTGANFSHTGKKNLSKRAIKGKLSVEKKECQYCKHHKMFIGNNEGQYICKCTKCKKELKL